MSQHLVPGDFMPAADWYVDPLGRYEGRYFDGEQWTDQVKHRGRLVVDPDWDGRVTTPRLTDDDSPDRPSVDEDDRGAGTDSEPGDEPRQASENAPAETAPTETAPTESALAGSGVDESDGRRGESPSRQVAVLADLEAAETAPSSRPPESVDGELTNPREPADRRWRYAVAAALIVGVVLILLLPRQFGDDDDGPPSSVTEAAGVEESANDDPTDAGIGLPASDAATDDPTTGDATSDPTQDANTDASSTTSDAADQAGSAADDGASAGTGDDADANAAADTAPEPPGDAMKVGSMTILNGRQMLLDLEVWHASSLGDRDVQLGAGAGCWFGAIGEAVVQNAHCGPVAATPGAEPRFDLVPLRFEDVEPGVIQVRPITDLVVPDAVLPFGVSLTGYDGPVEVEDLTEAAGG
ncbi:MAG: DUF2510 domain-containing protein [Actinomycetota bacterium]